MNRPEEPVGRCESCGAGPMQECTDVDCPNWDSRYDGIHDYSFLHYGEFNNDWNDPDYYSTDGEWK